MSDLFKEIAPVSAAAWQKIEDEARGTLKRMLAARKVVDFSGPLGWDTSAIGLGRVEPLLTAIEPGVEARRRTVLALIELRAEFELSRDELQAVGRGAKDPDLETVREAARHAAYAEDRAVFHGYSAAGIVGIGQASADHALAIPDDYAEHPELVAEAVNKLRILGVDGPYAIALGPRCYTGLNQQTHGGYPVIDHVRRLLSGPIVWAPGLSGAIVLSMRGGDFELTVGQDFSIGYLAHTPKTVQLYLQESFTFRVLSPEAAVPLVYTKA